MTEQWKKIEDLPEEKVALLSEKVRSQHEKSGELKDLRWKGAVSVPKGGAIACRSLVIEGEVTLVPESDEDDTLKVFVLKDLTFLRDAQVLTPRDLVVHSEKLEGTFHVVSTKQEQGADGTPHPSDKARNGKGGEAGRPGPDGRPATESRSAHPGNPGKRGKDGDRGSDGKGGNNGSSGGDGATVLYSVEKCAVGSVLRVHSRGANGGDGGNGQHGGSGGAGGRGGNGGKGGDASAFKSAKNGGSGGSGGSGGDGGNGGNGGDGGRGGHGGTVRIVLGPDTPRLLPDVNLKAGHGGRGGRQGNGGDEGSGGGRGEGGPGGEAWWWGQDDDPGGQPGSAGRAGRPGRPGQPGARGPNGQDGTVGTIVIGRKSEKWHLGKLLFHAPVDDLDKMVRSL